MINPIDKEAEMQELNHEVPSTSSLKDGISNRTSMSINDPDTMLSMTVLLLACLSLAVLAHAII